MVAQEKRYDLVIKNGTIITATNSYQADIGIVGEKIASIAGNLSAPKQIDATGKLVIPGGVDGHVHLQYFVGGLHTADDFFSGTQASALGGTTSIIDFVEAEGDEPFLKALHKRQAEAKSKAVIDYGFHITIKPTDMGKLAQIPDVISAGCPTFKHYMAYDFCLTDGELLSAFNVIAQAGGLAIVHAENWDVIQTLVAQNLAKGNIKPRWHPRSRPARFEGQAVRRAIDLAELAGVPLHIFHVSCDEAVQEIVAGISRGLPIYGESCPQYLLLDDTLFDRPHPQGALPVCSPPIRGKAEQVKLWRALQAGHLGVVSTDHCPFTIAQKGNGEDFSQIPGGIPGIQSRMMLLYNFGVLGGWLTPSQWVARCCTMPARLFGLANKGEIAVGFDADLVVFDPQAEMEISAKNLQGGADWTPYEGMQMRGMPAITLSRGKIICQNNQFVGEVGDGRFVNRCLS